MIFKKIIISAAFFLYLGSSWAAESCPYSHLLKAKYYNQAIKCAASNKDNVHENLFKWLKYKDREGTFEEITTFLLEKPYMPNATELARIAEDKINDTTNKDALKRWFIKHTPSTPNGMRSYIKTVVENKANLNQQDIKFIKRAFIRGNFTANARDDLFKKYKNHISKADVMDRVMHTIWHGDKKIEKQYVALLDQEKQDLLKGIVRVLNNEKNLKAIDNSIAESLRSHPDLLYSKALWYKKNNQPYQLVELLMTTPVVKDRNDDRWFKIRVGTAVDLMDKEDFENAYKVIAIHNYTDPVNYVDAEWLAGRLSYIYLKNPHQGLEHFKNIVDKSNFSISISKGSYWAGLAANDINMGSLSKSYFTKAAQYPDTYYGQLSLVKLGQADSYKIKNAIDVTPEDLSWFQSNILIKAAYSLFKYQKYSYARYFVKAAVLQANTVGQRFLVTEFGRQVQVHMMAVVSGKESSRMGVLFIEHSYPVIKPHPSMKELRVEEALVMSIIRQESEFNQYAKSHAGAMGLMQLIYPTAKDVSRELKSKFTRSSLYSDKHLNMRFGTFHLQKLLDYYDGSYILTICAYNAGRGNVDKWIKRFGDPRKLQTVDEVVAWVEKIPFYETRGYVQHVLSNVQMYRNVLKAKEKVSTLKINLASDLLKQKKKS